eukprot:CAMPEP_0117423874 /NCGR_PEP_ID=MMETSP0758-20121206/4405_1 /TAXON_ID=63605 /ORGANISM="Percolomonas cosmopolitus, Strain AE-1 (ATCC 50343)" /LENGTH=798 /DNA_ID=CAMNT_0005207313 /DNA_START=340 /DNA_END=2733 /DNA_ORIENTATION=-
MPTYLVVGDLQRETYLNDTASFRTSARFTGIPGPAWKILYSVENKGDEYDMGYLNNATDKAGELGRLSVTQFTTPYSKITAQQFHRAASRADIDKEIQNALINRTVKFAPQFGAYNIKAYDPAEKKLHYTLQYDNKTVSQAGTLSFLVGGNNFIVMSLMNYMNNLYMTNRTTSAHMVQGRASQMPYVQRAFTFDLIGQLGVFIFPMVLSTLIPTFTYSIVLEKVMKLREMQRLMGMGIFNYYLVVYISQYILYAISAIAFVAICAIFQFGFVYQHNWLVLLITLVGWGFTTVSFSFLLASIINDTLIASVAGYLLVLFGPIAGVILEQFVITKENSWRISPLLLIYPLQMNHATIAQVNACSAGACPSYESIWSDPYILQSLIYIYVTAVLYMVLAMYFNAVLPQTWGVRKHPFLCLGPIFNIVGDRIKEAWWSCKEKLVNKLNKKAYQDELDQEKKIDKDVMEEIKKVDDEVYTPENTGVLLKGLTKHFNNGRKKAVRGVKFAIKKKECFGLLGPNGAGKTTTISMLCGLIPVSHGTAFIVGKDIRKNMSKIHRSMGLCPQFDVLWNDLTCYQHLQYYCFLKGVPLSAQKLHIQNLLYKVGLWQKNRNGTLENIYSRRAGRLSGGMKRRLSIAIALCGNPDVILLDEPTTGLDPATKRSLWNLILEVKKDRCVILTTHSLEEADILSDRIGIIMSMGTLKCVGSSLHLKNKFGDGYKISLTFDEAHRLEATNFLLSIVPTARPSEMFDGRATYEVKRENFSVGDTFISMEEKGKEHHIKDFAINQTSLEDVFLNIVS